MCSISYLRNFDVKNSECPCFEDIFFRCTASRYKDSFGNRLHLILGFIGMHCLRRGYIKGRGGMSSMSSVSWA